VDGPVLERLKDASHAALDVLGADDRAALVTFSNALTLGADWDRPGGPIRRALDGVHASGGTALYDAAFGALAYSDPSPGRRNLVVLFSDGQDTSSWLPAHAVLDAAARSDVVVYAVTLGTPREEVRLQYRSGIQLRAMTPPRRGLLLAELAGLTGGGVTTARSPSKLRETFTTILNQFRSRYIITYTPEGVAATGWHAIEVRLTKESGTVAARRGYVK
jgi:VWFA-related protein